jgi:hypothetical protein
LKQRCGAQDSQLYVFWRLQKLSCGAESRGYHAEEVAGLILPVLLPADMSASAFHKPIDVIRYIPEVVRNWRGSTLMDADRIKVGARPEK